MAFLEIRDLHKTYDGVPVLRGIDLNVEQHQVVCLIGASGSGKSTLLRCITKLEDIDRGEISVDGDVVSGPGVDVNRLRRDVGIVFQSFNLFPHMTVLENVALAPVKVAQRPRREALADATVLLQRVGLADKAASYPDRLSGGQQQRVAIARALAMRPRVLLLDEVTSALDPVLVEEVLDLVRDLAAQGMTMVLATHEMAFAREVASTVCFLHEGLVLEQGPPEKLFSDPHEQQTRTFLRRVLRRELPYTETSYPEIRSLL